MPFMSGIIRSVISTSKGAPLPSSAARNMGTASVGFVSEAVEYPSFCRVRAKAVARATSSSTIKIRAIGVSSNLKSAVRPPRNDRFRGRILAPEVL